MSHSPLFVKAGAILPLGPRVQYSGEKPAAPIELRVYPGADGSYQFYEDAGEGWDYEKGKFSVIPITWNDKSRTLTIDKIRGSFPGMNANRVFKVVVVTPDQATGLEPATKTTELRYNGSKVSLRL
jgi:alpha-D-xyloside xylohydrolase